MNARKKPVNWALLGVMGAALTLAYGWVSATSAEEQGKAKAAHQAQKPKVMWHYAKLDLTDEQAAKISAIQADTAAKITALREAERQQIAAVLTPEQQDKLNRIVAHEKEEREKQAREKAGHGPEHKEPKERKPKD